MKKPSPSAKNKRGVKHRPTKGELAKRINTVYGLIVSGTRRAEILEFAGVQWGIERARVDNYISEANALILAEGAKERERAYAEEIALRNQIIKQALSERDYNAANTAARDRAKLRDLYPAERHEHEFKNVSDDELVKRATELARRITASDAGNRETRLEDDNAARNDLDAAPGTNPT